MKAVVGSAMLLVGLILPSGRIDNPSYGQTNSIDVQIVKYDELKQAILKQRGKVLIVDFWGEF